MISQKEIFLSRGYDVPSFYFDADGRKIEIETREDEEQSYRLDAIIKLLVGAGYYRAKIKGISPFDIVVGGMTWCLDSGDIDLDVDLLFEEGLSIGQKIALTEKIVVVLPKIKCPFFIEPHEIQGLNFIQIYPVIEWLINWSQVNREKQAAYLREYARNQYHKNFTNDNAESIRQKKLKCRSNLQRLMETYQHQLKRVTIQTNKSIDNIKLKLVSTLAEYGISPFEQSENNYISSSFDLHLSKEHQAEVLRGLSSQDFSEEKLNFEDVFDLVSSDYRSFAVQKKLKQLNAQLNELKMQEEKISPALHEEKQKYDELLSKLNDIDVDINSLSLEEQQTVLDIQELIKKHETLREEEKSKKASLKQELMDLQTAISELENSTIDEEIEQLQIQMEEFKKVANHKKLELADTARKVTSKERLLERIPTRAELSQYHQRYLELYRIHSMKTAEAKEDIMTYNMLNNRLKYIQKQNNLVNSIQETYSCVLSQGVHHDQFFQQIENIIEGVVKTKESIALSKMKTEEKKKELQNKLKQLQDEKTEYARTISQLNKLYKIRHSLLEKDEGLNMSIASVRAAIESFKASTAVENSGANLSESEKTAPAFANSQNSTSSSDAPVHLPLNAPLKRTPKLAERDPNSSI